MKTYTITFRNGESTEQKADWFTLDTHFGTPIARFLKKAEGTSEDRGEMIAAFTDVVSVIQKDV